MSVNAANHPHNQSVIPIFIDGEKYDAASHQMSGHDLRGLVPVAADRDLWLEVPGPSDDVPIKESVVYEVKSGAHFYTAPSTINPGTN
ncbi:hypothetical protein [Cognatiluteimonas telluris]|uniref:hypothetical protein n=1 Tax=Cognatiluteimonas telluris TaxID=1104775 RepID=UPI00140C5CB4|nr:hypothetical protein [Lysobacter telluris]